MGFIRLFSRQKVLANLLAVFFCVTGLSFFLLSPKESLPEIKLGVIVINTVYPNAAPQEVESLVTTPIEDAVKNIKGVKSIESASSESISTITLTLEAGVKNTADILNNIRNAAAKVRNLPENAEEPEIIEVTTDEFPIIQVSVSGGKKYAELRQAAYALSEKISAVDGVSSVRRTGYLDRAVWVTGNREKMARYSVTFSDIINALRNANLSIPAGNKIFGEFEYAVRVINPVGGAEAVKKAVIRSNEAGRAVVVSEVAEVYDGFKEETSIVKANGEKAVILTVLKGRGEDSIKIITEIKKVVSGISPEGIKVNYANDSSEFIKNRLNVVNSNGIVGAFFILGLLLLLLRPTISVLTAFLLPVSLGAALIAIKLMGLSYDMLSLFGFVMAIGMMVDNGIVVGENIFRYIESGKNKQEAVVAGASEVFVPALASTLTTVASFFPLIFVTGVLGSFLRPIPTVIIITLAITVLMAFTILPAQINAFEIKNEDRFVRRQNEAFSSFREKYGLALQWALKHKAAVVAVAVAVFVGSIFLGGLNGFSFFTTQVDEVVVDLKTPNTNSLEQTEKAVTAVEFTVKEFLGTDLDTLYSYSGRQETGGGLPELASNIGQVDAVLKLEDKRKVRDINVIIEGLKQKLGMPEGVTEISVKSVRREGGPARDDISINVTGETYADIKKAAENAVAVIKGVKGVKEVKTDLEQGKKEIRLVIDDRKTAATGVNMAQLGAVMRTYVAGTKAGSIKGQGEDIDIIVKADAAEQERIGALLAVKIPNFSGRMIPVRELVRVEEGYGFTVLKHKDTKKSLTVYGSIDKKSSNVRDVNAAILSKFEAIKAEFPDINFSAGGEFADMMEGFIDLGNAFLIALFLIYMILAALFNSYLQPLLIMLAIPFGFTGVMLTLFIHGAPISFGAFMGFVALSGVVVNNSIILNDFFNKMSAAAGNADEAIIEACKIRFRPIMLTTLTTAAGLLPLAYGILGSKDAFIQPVALVFAWGLLFSAAVTLFVIPVFLSIWHSAKR